jgi:hypothetical protein
MGLPDGGLFDIYANWTTPHDGHQAGVTADISSNTMTSEESRFFKKTAEELGIIVYEHTDPPVHFHIHL